MTGHKVFVYRNLREHKFTVRDLDNGEVTDVDEVWLHHATFQVSQAGRLRALRERQKNIHAGVVGTILDNPPPSPRCDMVVRYDPSRSPYFVTSEQRSVHEAAVVHLVDGVAFIPREARWL